MKLLIEIEGPAADKPVVGEPGVIEQIDAFTKRLVASRSAIALTTVVVRRLDPDVVVVKADQLMRLQKRANQNDAKRIQ